MTRCTIALIVTLSLGMFWAPLVSNAQSPAKVYRIGWLRTGSPAAGPEPSGEVFRQYLRDLGCLEGHNLALDERFAEGREERLLALAAELVHLSVDVIVAVGHAAIRAAQQATHTIPIVMLVGGDPVGSGLISNLAHPGSNLTGIATLSPRLSAQRLTWLKRLVPQVSRVAVLFNPDDETKVVDWHQTQAAARALGVQLLPLEVRSLDGIERAFVTLGQAQTGALITLSDAVTLRYRRQIVTLAVEHRLPGMYEFREFVEEGGLMAYGPRLSALFQQVAGYVDKILKGAKPADLPVEQPTKFELAINLNTAKALGLTIPPTLLSQADELIQ
jgi:putative tryptophan/tyrosine transport system substrate-binding protein